ncbi:MAG TPA: glycosyltransferase family 2 protein [Chloroflexi bacterium]|nr:glycosyltransferase family 2 protein [Chloroflexota bacterium]
MPDNLAVIIVSYNVRSFLEKCLSSLLDELNSADFKASTYVIDNASSDGSPELVRKRFPSVNLIANESNLGFAAANNLVMRELLKEPAPPDYFFLLNPDTQVCQGAICKLLNFMENHPVVAVAGPKLLNPDGSLQHSAFRFPGLMQVFLDFFPLHHRIASSPLNGRYPRRLYERGKPFPVDHPLGAAMMVRREAVEQVGLMDEGFFMYCEEIDWCIRFRKAGWQIYCVPEAEIVHHIARSTSQFQDRMFVELWRSRYRLFTKYRGPLFLKALRLLVKMGLRRKIAATQAAARKGVITPQELQRRLEAYLKVMEM